jgi:hypothetical protein
MEHNSTNRTLTKNKTMMNKNGEAQQEEKTSFEHRHHYFDKLTRPIIVNLSLQFINALYVHVIFSVWTISLLLW